MRKPVNDYDSRLPKIQHKSDLRRMVKHPFFGYIILCVLLLIFQILFMYTDFISLSVSRAVNLTMIYTIASLGYGLLLMMCGLLSLSTGVFIGLGTYLAGNILKLFDIPFVLILAVMVVAGIIIGLVVGFISLRAQGIHLLIVTLALAYILGTMYILPNPFTGGPNGLRNVPYPTIATLFVTNRETMYFVVLAVLFLLIALTVNIINSPVGRAFLSVSRSESLARAMGINLLKYRLLAFILSSVYAMIAGALYIASYTSSNATSWTSALGSNILVAVIIGGTAKPAGIFLGCAVMFGLNVGVLSNIEFFARNSTAASLFMGILIILIVMKYPAGLMGFLESIKAKIRGSFMKRRLKKYGPEQ